MQGYDQRLETMVLTAAPIPLESIRKQIASALDVIIFLSRMKDKSRKVVEISEVTGYENGDVVLNPLYKYEMSKRMARERTEKDENPYG